MAKSFLPLDKSIYVLYNILLTEKSCLNPEVNGFCPFHTQSALYPPLWRGREVVMKRLLSLLCLLVLASGCATVVHGPSGKILTGHRSDPTPTATVALENHSSQPILVDYRWPATDFQQVDPGQPYEIDSKTYWKSRLTVKWFCAGCSPTEVGQTEEQMSFEVTMLYDQKPIVIDDFFLRKMMIQRGVIINSEIVTVRVWNDRDIDYGEIGPRQSSGFKELMPGPVTFYVQIVPRPSDRCYSYDRGIRSFSIMVDNKGDDYTWVDERGVSHLVGWKVNVEPTVVPMRW